MNNEQIKKTILESQEIPNDIILWAKLREDVKVPTKRDEDAGYDIYANFEEDYIKIKPHETKMISTGLASAFSKDFVFILKERGSNGTKGIAQRSGVIDSGFRAEWKVPLTNTTNKELYIVKQDKLEKLKETLLPYEKAFNFGRLNNVSDDELLDMGYIFYPYEKGIAQGILVPVPKVTSMEISYDELKQLKSERGEGMIGSSGK